MPGVQSELLEASIYGVNPFLEAWRRVFRNLALLKSLKADTRTLTVMCIQLGERLDSVAKGKQGNVAEGSFRFVSCPVGEGDLENIEKAYPTADTTFDFLVSVLTEGLKVSFSLNDQNHLVICSLYDRRTDSPSFGACLTGGAENWYDALRVAAYKYTALLHGDLGADNSPGSLTRRIW